MAKKLLHRQKLFECFAKAQPYPVTELIYHSPFELLVAVILSAQTTDKRVNQVTTVLFKVANTPYDLLQLGEATLLRYIRSVNYSTTKAKHICRTCALLLEKHDGTIPNDRAALEALPGVGRKTANVILNVIFGHPTIAVDTHIFRVSNRTGLAMGKTPRAVEEKLLSVVPAQYQREAHHWLVLHGRYVCKAKKPLCGDCLIQDFCAKNF